jgi:hypothetical protein
MHDCVVRQYSDHGASDPHSGEFLVAHDAKSLVGDSDMPVAPTLAPSYVVSKMKTGGNGDSLGFPELRNDSRLIDQAVGGSNTPTEVGFQVTDREIIRD